MRTRALITAGAGGIGLAIARKFAAEGAAVHIIDVNAEALEKAVCSYGFTGSAADIAEEDGVNDAVEDAARSMGGLDVLINNAGVAGPTAVVADYPLAAWRHVMDINLTGTFMVTAAAIPHLVKAEAASIIIMSSLAGRFGYPQRAAYSTSKWGLIGLTKTLAMELGPQGVTCNAILPGAVAGDRIEQVLAGRASASGAMVKEERAKAYRNQSVQRFVEAEEIADLAFFLAGPSARSISGQSFPIDGDSRSSV
jgi:NAD(P)-dependent dehydrogenase (short-subunit alcohol dehydrogenase family)